MKKPTLAATAAILLASGAALHGSNPALAQSGPAPMGHGTVTWAEAKARADMLWTRLDVNQDGVLNAADREAKTAKIFDQIDTNHDGAISRGEFLEHHKAMTKGKGRARARPAMGGASMDGRPPIAMMMGHGGRMMHEMAEKADTNLDQSISRTEFDAATKDRFDKADANHDGKLTAAERRAARAVMHEGRDWRGGHGRGSHGGMGAGIDRGMGDMPPPGA